MRQLTSSVFVCQEEVPVCQEEVLVCQEEVPVCQERTSRDKIRSVCPRLCDQH